MFEPAGNTGEPEVSEQNVSSEGERREDSETDREADTDVGESSEGAARSIPETLEQIPEGYDAPADQQAGTLKHVIDHAIQDGRMQPMIIVCLLTTTRARRTVPVTVWRFG